MQLGPESCSVPTMDMESREYWHACVCACACKCKDVYVCCVQANWLTSWRDGGDEKENCSSPCLCLAGECEWGGLRCGGRGQTDSSNHDLPQDPGFGPADVILSQHGCSKASRGCIPPCLSSSMTACVSFPARASLDLLLQQLRSFVPFPGLQLGRKASHLRSTMDFGCHLPPQGSSAQVCQRKRSEKGSRERIAAQRRRGSFETGALLREGAGLPRGFLSHYFHQFKRGPAALPELSQLAYEAL